MTQLSALTPPHHLVNYEVVYNNVYHLMISGWFETREEILFACVEAYCKSREIEYDDIPDDGTVEALNDPNMWTINGVPNQYRTQTGSQAYFVNVYELGRCYGGPEEGGWWFDTGDYLFSHICNSWEEAEKVRDSLKEEYPNLNHRSKTIPMGDDYSIEIDLGPGANWPEEWPHYE